LQTLELGGTKVTDAGLKELVGLNNLQTLQLAGTKVTGGGAAELHMRRPYLRILPHGAQWSAPAP
jgi:hypothetical protein